MSIKLYPHQLRRQRHGLRHTRLYRIWAGVKQRLLWGGDVNETISTSK